MTTKKTREEMRKDGKVSEDRKQNESDRYYRQLQEGLKSATENRGSI